MASQCERVVGLDLSSVFLQRANEHKTNWTQDTSNVTFIQGSVYDVPFADSFFHACRMDRVMQHLDEPQRAILELLRVLKPGARLVVGEPDWDTLILSCDFEPDHVAVADALRASMRTVIKNPYIGRQLPALFRQCGLKQTTCSIHVCHMHTKDESILYSLPQALALPLRKGAITKRQMNDYIKMVDDFAGTGAFYASLNLFVVSGVKAD